jgi:hypothetical protein
MKKTTILLLLIITLSSYSQITKQTTFNQKSENYLNKSSDVLYQKDSIEKLIPISEFDNSMRDADFFSLKQSKNNTLYLKANSENTIRLDSSSIVNMNKDGISGKTEEAYDENGNLTLRIEYNWDADSAAFIPNYKAEYAYDENGFQTLYIKYSWDADSAAFILDVKRESAYDENGRTTLYIPYNWDADSAAFIPNFKAEYAYDENGRTTLYIDYNWDADSAAFIPNFKVEYAYDENGRQTLYIPYNWDADSAAFIPDVKTEYAYDENGRTTLYIQYNWDADSAAFIPDVKREYAYDENNTQIGNTEMDYNSDFGVFVPTINTVFEFDNLMRVISEKTYDIDICNNEKVLRRRRDYKYLDGYEGRSTLYYNVEENGQSIFQYEIGNYYQDGRMVLRVQIANPAIYDPSIYSFTLEYTFNENGNQTLFIRNSYDEQTDSLIPDFKQETSYDEDYNLQEVVYSNWYAGLGVYKPSIKKEYSIILDTDTKRIREGLLSVYDTNFNQWNTLTDEKYHSYWYYTKSSTLSSESINKDTNVLFPNPTSKFLKVNLSDSILNPFIEIFDITGKKVFSKKIQSGDNIDVSSLAPAIYVYKIKDGSTIKKSGKIIKE